MRLMVELANNYRIGPLSLSEVAGKEGISEKFLGQIMHVLKSEMPITSVRGPKGGYKLSVPPSKIRVGSILGVFEPTGLTECVRNADACRRSSICKSRAVWVVIDKIVRKSLQSITLADLVSKGRKKNEKRATARVS